MRRLWLELIGYNSAINLNGESNIIDHLSFLTDSATALRLERLSNSVTITDLSGLGFEMDVSSSYVDPFGYVTTREHIAQPAVAGVVNLKSKGVNTPYTAFNDLAAILDSYSVRLRYAPRGESYDNAYLMDGAVTKLLKGEIKAARIASAFEFRGAEPFYQIFNRDEQTLAANTALAVKPSRGELSGFRNSFRLTMTMTGTPSSNFGARIYHRNGYPAAVLELNKTLSRGDVLVWSSDPEDPKVTINGVDQLYLGAVDISQEVFPSITGSDLLFVAGDDMEISMEFKTFRRAV